MLENLIDESNGKYSAVSIGATLEVLERDGIITFSNDYRTIYQLTNDGCYAEELGYERYCKEIGDKRKQQEETEEVERLLKYKELFNATYGF